MRHILIREEALRQKVPRRFSDSEGDAAREQKPLRKSIMADTAVMVIVSVFFIFGVYSALRELTDIAKRLARHIRRIIDKKAKRDYNK